MKKVILIIAAVILICLAAYGLFNIRGERMVNIINKEYYKVGNIDLNKVEDGAYKGSYGDFIVSVELTVDVRDHKITGIHIDNQLCGQGYEAGDMVNRIIAAQTPLADVVSGASSSSKCIMIAAYRALQK
ncbi:MAG TPA: FMN-binding protein [Clostridia bacterium]|nr:FMN-binding protein [Clostridia bacterium]